MTYGVRLTLAYDGTEFAGFQRQPEARTVQGVLEAAAAKIAQHSVLTRGAGRTDAGVHAEGQIVAFDTARDLPAHRWLLALNRYLPADAAVQHVAACEPNYDPRFDAIDKTYRYLFHLGLARDPLLRHRAWHLLRSGFRVQGEAWLGAVGAMLDLEAMRSSCALLVGTHDFRAFRAADDMRENTQRTLHRVQLVPDWNGQRTLLALEVQGSAFMKNMVRILAGTLISVGRGKLKPNDVSQLLSREATRSRHSETAPPHGLTLVQVRLGRLREAPER
jgi:tRNA pseudouridine38-40 synthase